MDDHFNHAADNVTNAAETTGQAAASGTDKIASDLKGRTRDVVQNAAETAKVRAAEMHDNLGKVTHALETSMLDAVGEAAKVSRELQQAAFKDAEAFWIHVGKLTSAKSLSEAIDTQGAFVRERSEVMTARARTSGEYLTKLLNERTKAIQDNLAQVQSYSRKVA